MSAAPGPHAERADDELRHDEQARHEQGRRRDSRFTRLYGASPWHLLAMLALGAVTAYTASRLLDDPALWRIALWFVGAAVVWDLLLGPALAGADVVLRRLLGRRRPRGVRAVNYVRIPALLSGLLLLVYAPLVLRRSEPVFAAKAGLSQDPYLGRWLAVTAALFVASGLLYGIALLRARR